LSHRIKHSLVSALAAVPDFASLDERALLRVLGASANLMWSAGGLVFEQGAPGDALYIILSGRIQIVDPEGPEETEVAVLGPGDFFGELSLLLHTQHTKSARALEDTELMVLPKASFQELLASHAELAGHFRSRLQTRLGLPEAAKLPY
jgi:CRP-like cAMP-binding protein